MKKVVLCDDHAYYITDEDFEKLETVSPGLARMAKDSHREAPTHFVCEHCGQVPPVKLRDAHQCRGKIGGTGKREEMGSRQPSDAT